MKKVDKSKFNNSWYNPGGSSIKRLAWYYINILVFINPIIPFYGIKSFLLKLFGAKVGRRLIVKPGVNIKYPWKLEVGDYVSFGENVWIDNLELVSIGDHSTLSQGAMILTGNHNYKSESWDLITRKVTLEYGVWIGAKSIVCPGVTCKSHSVLSVGSVATSDLKEFTIYQGNPAQEIKKRIIES